MIVVSDSSPLITLSRAQQHSNFQAGESFTAMRGSDGFGCTRSAIFLALSLRADVVLIDEARARRRAECWPSSSGFHRGLERGALLKRVVDLGSVYLSLLDQGIRFDPKLLEQSLARLGLAKLKP